MTNDTKIEQVTAEMDELSFDPTMKKKKSSKKKNVAFEDPSAAEAASESAAAVEPGSFPLPSYKTGC